MLKLIQTFFENLKKSWLASANEWIQEAAEVIKGMWSIKSFGPSLKYVGLPMIFEIIFDFGLLTLDFFLDSLSVVPFQAFASTLLDQFKVPGKLRQKVLTLDQASILVARIIVREGIQAKQGGLPIEWQTFQFVDRIDKLGSVIKAPSIKRVWKLIFGSIWTRIVRVVLLVFIWGKLLGLLGLLYKWIKLVMNEAVWPVIFSGALSQSNPRQNVRTTIMRRIGGVHP